MKGKHGFPRSSRDRPRPNKGGRIWIRGDEVCLVMRWLETDISGVFGLEEVRRAVKIARETKIRWLTCNFNAKRLEGHFASSLLPNYAVNAKRAAAALFADQFGDETIGLPPWGSKTGRQIAALLLQAAVDIASQLKERDPNPPHTGHSARK